MTDGVRGRKEEKNFVRWLLWLGVAGACLIATVKVIFVGFSADEEYQLLLTYRLAKGDRLFREVWDTLQTSAFYGQLFTWIYLKIVHTTTGLLLFLRLCGVATQGAVSLFLFLTLKKHLKMENALLLAATFFCTYAKLVAMPEFSNLQAWGLTVMLCLLWRVMDLYCEAEYWTRSETLSGESTEKSRRISGNKSKETVLLVLAALFFCVAVLASACLILIPIVAVFLYRMKQDGGIRRNLIFWGTCLACGLAYVAGLMILDGPSDLWFGIQGLLAGDDTHASGALLNGNAKGIEYLQEAGKVCAFLVLTLGIAALVSWILSHVKKERNQLWMPLWLGLSYGVTLFHWFVSKSGYEGMKLHYPVLAILGIFAYLWLKGQRDGISGIVSGANKEENRREASDKQREIIKRDVTLLPAVYGILLGIGVFVNVLCFSNVGLICNLTFLSISALWGMVLLVAWLETEGDKKGQSIQVIGMVGEKGRELAVGFALSFFAISVMGTALTLNYGPSGSTILDLRSAGRMQAGPAKGTIVARQIANFYGANEATFREVVKEGSRVLIVTSFFHNQSLTTMYMLNDAIISHYTVNSTPTYGEQLLAYWERYPERKPDCIIINGDSCPAEDYQWATELIEGYGDMELRQIYSTYFYMKPECVK